MATMVPEQVSQDTKSMAERRLFDAFRDKLPPSYTVFHSVMWQTPAEKGGWPQDGEADFVIAHPHRGLLVLEVKGGIIRYDAKTRRWTSTDRSQAIHDIKDPFKVAMESKHVLMRHLKRMTGRTGLQLRAGHAVAFPDVVLPREILGPDKPRDIIMDQTDTVNVAEWVAKAMAYYGGGTEPGQDGLGGDGVDALMRLLGRSWEIRPALWGPITHEDKALATLTEQQYGILDILNYHDRALIGGCAGSGKTMLAAEKAARLARQGATTLLTCFNRNLAVELRARLKGHPNLTISHFHEVCSSIAQRAGVLPSIDGLDDQAFFDKRLPEALLDALTQIDDRYDAVVVDEGQDFKDDWWVPLQELLRDPKDGTLYIFYDDNQNLYQAGMNFPISDPPYALTVNCRNTQIIHRTVARLYKGKQPPTARGPEGRPVELVIYAPGELRPVLVQLLTRLATQDQVPSDEVVLLTPFGKGKSQLWGMGLPLTDDPAVKPGSYLTSTVHGFKGLERPVVVLAELDRWRDLDNTDELQSLLYVACSRARNHLIVLLPQDAPDALKKWFSPGLNTKKA